MKRPEGFDGNRSTPSSFGAAKRPVQQETDLDETPQKAARVKRGRPVVEHEEPRSFDTEPIEFPVLTEDEPEESDSDEATDFGPSLHQTARQLRAARRGRNRYERDEIKRFTTETRRRRRNWLIGIGSVVGLFALLVLISISPLMSLRTIDVVGTSRLKASDVERALDDQLGTPLPFVDSAEIKKNLAGFPLIRSYSIETHPPGTLIVRIVERQPIGLLQTSTGYDLVDQAGVVISRGKDKPAGYPVISSPGAAGSAQAQKGFAASAAVLASLPQSVLPQVGSITAATEDDVTLTLTSGKKVVWGSPDQSSLKAADLAALLKTVPTASSYDVSSPESPVTQ